MSPLHSLTILLSLFCAHAVPFKISLHNKDSVRDAGAVRNWTLLCEDLCSLGISGPACGLECQHVPVNEDLVAKISNISAEDHEELCGNLCEYGLDNQCKCKVSIIPALLNFMAYILPAHHSDRFKICSDTCRFYKITLKSCPQCPFVANNERSGRVSDSHPVRNVAHSAGTTPPPFNSHIPVPQSAKPTVFRPVPQSNLVGLRMASTTPDPTGTTPDWNRLCAQLCRNGTGGLLCNCDLPPF